MLYSLALLSSLAGNLLLSGSLTNVLIAEQRRPAWGRRLSFRDHARAGVPIALISLAFASFWLVAIGILPLTPPPVPPPLP